VLNVRSPGRLKLAKRRADNRPNPTHIPMMGYYVFPHGTHRFTIADLAEDDNLRAAYTQAVMLADAEGRNVRWN
jgi:hypothetical protein